MVGKISLNRDRVEILAAFLEIFCIPLEYLESGRCVTSDWEVKINPIIWSVPIAICDIRRNANSIFKSFVSYAITIFVDFT